MSATRASLRRSASEVGKKRVATAAAATADAEPQRLTKRHKSNQLPVTKQEEETKAEVKEKDSDSAPKRKRAAKPKPNPNAAFLSGITHWLMKSEPDVFGIDELEKKGVAPWDGVRNLVARNLMRDFMRVGHDVLFYHSSCKEPAVVGLAKVAKAAYPDHTAWDKSSKYYDAKSTPEEPVWHMVDVQFARKLSNPVTLRAIKAEPSLSNMWMLTKFRLSVTPVTDAEWATIMAMAAADGADASTANKGEGEGKQDK